MGTVFAGTGTVWKIPTRGIPVPNPKHLSNLNRDSGGREICNMQVRIFLEYQRVGQRIDVIGIPIS